MHTNDARKPLVELILHRRIFGKDQIHAAGTNRAALYRGSAQVSFGQYFWNSLIEPAGSIGRTGEECLGNCPC